MPERELPILPRCYYGRHILYPDDERPLSTLDGKCISDSWGRLILIWIGVRNCFLELNGEGTEGGVIGKALETIIDRDWRFTWFVSNRARASWISR